MPRKAYEPYSNYRRYERQKIDYNAKFRCDKTQGCFVGILFQTPHDEVLNNYEFKIKFEEALAHNTAVEIKYEEALARIQAVESEMKKMIYPPVSNDETAKILDVMESELSIF